MQDRVHQTEHEQYLVFDGIRKAQVEEIKVLGSMVRRDGGNVILTNTELPVRGEITENGAMSLNLKPHVLVQNGCPKSHVGPPNHQTQRASCCQARHYPKAHVSEDDET